MYIDDCRHTFDHLASTVLPGHMRRLRAVLANPHPASLFHHPSSGPKRVAQTLHLPDDFSGCYVLLEDVKPVYVGISRRVLARLRQHFRGKTHFDASLAYAIAKKERPTAGARTQVMGDEQFKQAFDGAQEYLRGLHVAFVEIDNPVELHVFEAYAAMTLGTSKWNTFRTH
jgi:hypothetical protein